MKRILPILFAIAMVAAGCSRTAESSRPEVSTVMLAHTFERLQAQPSAPMSPAESAAIEAFMRYRGYTSVDSMMADVRMARALSSFGPLVHSTFADTAALTAMVADIADRANSAGVQPAAPRYAFVIWNDVRSMAFVDSILLVALNHYLGADCPFYRGLPEYTLQGKTPAQLPLDIAEAQVATQYPFIGQTALARIAYEGVLAMARQQLTGCTESAALGYSEEQWEEIERNESRWWRQLASLKLIYTADRLAIDQLVMPAPYTTPLGPDAPPRLGRYFGYRIVQAWLNRNGRKPLSELLAPQFYADVRLLRQSGYNPN